MKLELHKDQILVRMVRDLEVLHRNNKFFIDVEMRLILLGAL